MNAKLMNIAMMILLASALAELAYVRLAKRGKVHTLRDTLSSISMGIGQQTINLYLTAAFLAGYAAVQTRFGVFTVDRGSWWQWALLVLACDLSFYVGHRTAHTVNLFVAGHIPHHQAEDYNLLSSLRQGWVAWVQMAPFYLPLAVVGVPFEMLVQAQIGIMCAQFFSHYGATRVRLGVLDRIFVTPENHRVHHGYGKKYGGANCGGMLVIWDRLFGSFVVEDSNDPVKIGSGLALDFHDPIEAHLDYYRRIWTVARSRRGLGKLTIWFQSPGTLYRELARLPYSPSTLQRAPAAAANVWLTALWAVACLGFFVAHRVLFLKSGTPLRIFTGVTTLIALVVLGRILSGRVSMRTPSRVVPQRLPSPARTA